MCVCLLTVVRMCVHSLSLSLPHTSTYTDEDQLSESQEGANAVRGGEEDEEENDDLLISTVCWF